MGMDIKALVYELETRICRPIVRSLTQMQEKQNGMEHQLKLLSGKLERIERNRKQRQYFNTKKKGDFLQRSNSCDSHERKKYADRSKWVVVIKRSQSEGRYTSRRNVEIFLQNKPPEQRLKRSQSWRFLNKDTQYPDVSLQRSSSCPHLRGVEGLSSISQLVGSEGFEYWTKGVLALNQTRETSVDVVKLTFQKYVEKEFDTEELNVFLQCQEENDVNHLKGKNKEVKFSRKGKEKNKQVWECKHYTCQRIFLKLLKKYSSDQMDQWVIQIKAADTKNKSSSDDFRGAAVKPGQNELFWRIEKLFMDPETSELKCNSLEKLDISQIMKLHRNCNLFIVNRTTQFYDEIISHRNKLMHSPDNKISKDLLEEIFKTLSNYLKDFSAEFPFCQQVQGKLKELESATMVISVFSNAEVAEEALKIKEEALESDYQNSNEGEKQKYETLLVQASEQRDSFNMERDKMNDEMKQLRRKKNDIEQRLKQYQMVLEAQKRKEIKDQQTAEETKRMYAQMKMKYESLKETVQKKDDDIRRETKKTTKLQQDTSFLQDMCKQLKKEKDDFKERLQEKDQDIEREKQKTDVVNEKMQRIQEEYQKLKESRADDPKCQHPELLDFRISETAEHISAMYNDVFARDWPVCFDILTRRGLSRREAIDKLLDILSDFYADCRVLVKTRKKSTDTNLATLERRIWQISLETEIIDEVKQKLYNDVKKGNEQDRKVIEDCKDYAYKIAELCWLVCSHRPELQIKFTVNEGQIFEEDVFAIFESAGSQIHFLVWPPLYIKRGADYKVLVKGWVECT